MIIKEAFVTRENPAEIFSIIEDVLSINPNTQVFIDKSIYKELYINGSNYNVYNSNLSKSNHYAFYHDDYQGGEDWLELKDTSSHICASFISNCKEYKQLVEFYSSKVRDYTHYLAGFNQLLLIYFKHESL